MIMKEPVGCSALLVYKHSKGSTSDFLRTISDVSSTPTKVLRQNKRQHSKHFPSSRLGIQQTARLNYSYTFCTWAKFLEWISWAMKIGWTWCSITVSLSGGGLTLSKNQAACKGSTTCRRVFQKAPLPELHLQEKWLVGFPAQNYLAKQFHFWSFPLQAKVCRRSSSVLSYSMVLELPYSLRILHGRASGMVWNVKVSLFPGNA